MTALISSQPTALDSEDGTPRVALFTTDAPDRGATSVIIRSFIPQLLPANIRWFYLSRHRSQYPGATHLGEPLIGRGSVVSDMLSAGRLFTFRGHPFITKLAKEILAWKPDTIWIVGANEGLPLARELANLKGSRLHLTIHDDPSALCSRSRRYRILVPLASRLTKSLLAKADSVDFVSEGMKKYYESKTAVSGRVIYRYLEPAINSDSFPNDGPSTKIRIGHVGSLYRPHELAHFLRCLGEIEKRGPQRFEFVNIGGASRALRTLDKRFPGIIRQMGHLCETEAVAQLQSCDFVYAMYPFSPRYKIFRRTSLPLKLTTYFLASRPIFAHCPPDSSLAEVMNRFNIGSMVSSVKPDDLMAGVNQILKVKLIASEIQRAREHYCGHQNVLSLRSALRIG
jgi:hypothetical protein